MLNQYHVIWLLCSVTVFLDRCQWSWSMAVEFRLHKQTNSDSESSLHAGQKPKNMVMTIINRLINKFLNGFCVWDTSFHILTCVSAFLNWFNIRIAPCSVLSMFIWLRCLYVRLLCSACWSKKIALLLFQHWWQWRWLVLVKQTDLLSTL